MPQPENPDIYAFILELALYLLISFGIFIVSVSAVYGILFWRGNFTGNAIVSILRQTDVPKLATIILIVLASCLLGMMGIIQGEAIIALLSGIAGYVLGDQVSTKARKSDADDEE